jgi:hypothetical protein
MTRRRHGSRSPSRNSRTTSPNSIINISPITTPEDFYTLTTPPREIHPNITIRDRDRNRIIHHITPETPPQYVTIREPRAPRRRRALTMDDDEIYNVLLEIGNENPYSLSPTNDDVELYDNFINNSANSDRFGINASEPFSYERNQEYNIAGLSNKELDKHKDKIKIKKTQTTIDPIMMDDINIHHYIKEDVDNIVFIYENNYYLSTKSILGNFINMATTDNAIVFDCRGIGYRNVNYDYPYVLFNKLGIILNDFTNVISLENAIAITKPTSGQHFLIKGTDDVLISTVTDNVLNGKHPNALGASHCQSGKSAIVFDIQSVEPEYKSHSKTSKTHKKHHSKSPKKSVNKSIKKHVKRMLK